MGQLELDTVPNEGWTIDPDVCSLLDGPCDVVELPTNYRGAIPTDVMPHDVGIVIDGEGGPEVFPEPFSKGTCRFSYLLFITVQFVIHVPVEYYTYLYYVIPVLGGYQEVLGGFTFLEKDLGPLPYHRCS